MFVSSVSTPAPSTPAIPPRPEVPAELLELADQALFRGEYRAVERDTWREGLPLLGRKVSSSRDVAFSNDFHILRTPRGPMIGYASASYDDALRAARDRAYDWSDPSFGGRIYSSVGMAVLQAADGAYYTALVGSGDPDTDAGELGYRSDRFDNDVYGSAKLATDLRATSSWSAPTDKDGRPVDVAAPGDERPVRHHDVEQVAPPRIVSSAPQLKAVVDVRSVFGVEPG